MLDASTEDFVFNVRLLRCTLALSLNNVEQKEELVVHIRGGSDIFGMEKGKNIASELNPGYTQPPLAYYLKVLEHWIPGKNTPHVKLITMDFSNPCLDELKGALDKLNIPFQVFCGNINDDAQHLMDATTVVTGYGTFVPILNVLSDNVVEIYCFRGDGFWPQYKKLGKRLYVVDDLRDSYTKPGSWANTNEQIEMMLSYPIDSLGIRMID